jgi:hypothetical protein
VARASFEQALPQGRQHSEPIPSPHEYFVASPIFPLAHVFGATATQVPPALSHEVFSEAFGRQHDAPTPDPHE